MDQRVAGCAYASWMPHQPSLRAIVGAVAVVIGLVGAIAFVAGRDVGSEAAAPLVRPNPATGPFEGLGVWVDIHDDEAWTDPAAALDTMVSSGARTLFLQTSNGDRSAPFVYRDQTAAFIEAAHDRDVEVVAGTSASHRPRRRSGTHLEPRSRSRRRGATVDGFARHRVRRRAGSGRCAAGA